MSRTWAEVKAEMQDIILTRLLNLQSCDGLHHRTFAPHPEPCKACERGYLCGFQRRPCPRCRAAI